ncbi:Membrane protein, partial [Globisporangium splendens]
MGATLTKPVCIAAGITYPAYASFKALESPSPDDDKQWLTYWVVYGLCTSMETVSSRLMSWMPGYYMTKMLFLIWMMLPKTKGAMIMYRVVFYPLLKQYEPYVDRKLLDAQRTAQDSVTSLQKAGKEAIAKQLEAVQKSDVVTKVGQAIVNSAMEAQQKAVHAAGNDKERREDEDAR